MCATRCTFWSIIFLNAHGDVARHTVEEAAIFDEEAQEEETNKVMKNLSLAVSLPSDKN